MTPQTPGPLLAACHDFSHRLPASLTPGGNGWAAGMACMLEASAPKPGNVHPGADFQDLSHAELMAAAVAIAPVFDASHRMPLGDLILDAVRRSRAVTRSNANLGIILALAPLAAVSEGTWRECRRHDSFAFVCNEAAAAIAGLGPVGAASVWTAIGLASPGGMDRADRHDLAGPPPADMLDAMRIAAERDQIARLWACGYAELCEGLVADLAAALDQGLPWREAIVEGFLRQLARTPDSLIQRRHGPAVAAEVSRRAAAVLAMPTEHRLTAEAEFDRSLRVPRRINPGTTADLVAAAVYILLRSFCHDRTTTP